MKIKVNLHDVKQALLDARFRETLPEHLLQDVQKFLKNPGCACNHPIYIRIIKEAGAQLASYFPTKEPVAEEDTEKLEKIAANDWEVINCSVHELADRLRKLRHGRKQLDIARWQDQVTVVINHLDDLF